MTCQIQGEKQTAGIDKTMLCSLLIDGTGCHKQRVRPISCDTHILTCSDYRWEHIKTKPHLTTGSQAEMSIKAWLYFSSSLDVRFKWILVEVSESEGYYLYILHRT